MATSNLSIILSLQDKASAELSKFQKKISSMEGNLKSLQKKSAIAFGVITTAVGLSVREFAKFEQAQVAFESMLGSAEEAKDMIKELAEFSAKTPFQFEDIVGATRTLLAFGIESENVNGTLKFLGDIASGAQVPLGDLAQIFGKVQTKGKAMTEEIMQMSERGIPIIDELAKQFNVSKEAIFEMAEQGELTADVVTQALMSMTQEGGIFEDQMIKQSETISGKWSTMKDNLVLTMVAIGESFKGESVFIIDAVTRMAESFKGFSEENQTLIKWVIIGTIAFTGLLFLITTVGLAIIAVSKFFIALGAVFSVTGIMAGLFVAKFLLIAVAIGIIIYSIWNLVQNWDLAWGTMKIVMATIGNTIKGIWEGIVNFVIDGINWLINQINSLLDKLSAIPKVGKKFEGFKISTFERVQFDRTDTGAMYNDMIMPKDNTQVVVTGNTFLSEDVAEQMGDLMMKKLKLNTAV